MKFKANFVEKPVNFQMDDCQIEKVVELPHDDFCRLKITPLEDQPFLAENKDCMFHMDGVIHCLLALGQGSNDGVLIDAERYNYPRLAAYVPGMRRKAGTIAVSRLRGRDSQPIDKYSKAVTP